jgi:hydrogenase nickel incorporation protein HypA/HybF
MHELSLCQALITQVERVACEHRARAVTRILIQVGSLSGVEPSLLEHAFPLASAGTLAEGAELVIEKTPIRVRCSQCGIESEASANRLLCAACGDYHTQLISGDEMLLQSLEFDVESVPSANE